MKKINFLLLILCGIACRLTLGQEHGIASNGMTFKWSIDEQAIHCEVFAPSKGWVAVGFNPDDGLPNTHLIMGAAEQDFYEISDRHIVGPGDHRSTIALGGSDPLFHRKVTENNKGTVMSFSLPLEPNDRFHHRLKPGMEIHLLLAYSHSDDLDHHSAMRTAVLIQL